MTEKRFIEFATQQTDNGEINNGFQDIMSGEWYYTKDSENAKKICELLNELHEENELLHEEKELLNNKLNRIEDILPHYLSCAEISEFRGKIVKEDMALMKCWNKRYRK